VKYPAKIWNSLLRKAEQYLPVRFDYTPPSARPHPWQIRPVWHKDKNQKYGEWRGIVTAGCVNGLPVYVRMKFSEASSEAQLRIENNALLEGKPKPKPTSIVKVYLDETAEIKFLWRNVGGLGEDVGFERVPEFFTRLGVQGRNTNYAANSQQDVRLLRACDIVLNQPRVALTNEVTINAQTIASTLVEITPGFTSPKDLEPFLLGIPQFVPVKLADSFADIFFRRYDDTPKDQLLIATVYLLSPKLPIFDSNDLSNWQCYFKYESHYNLVHATKQFERTKDYAPFRIVVPLVAGIAQNIVDNILATNNFYSQAVTDFYRQKNLEGKFHIV